MHLASPSTTIFGPTMILGTILTLSSPNWVLMWAGLEMNLMSFIPLLLLDKKTHHMEITVKYFIIQAFGSMMILYSYNKSAPFLLLALFLKMGAAPMHFWFINMVKQTPWASLIMLMTWQKIAPLAVLNNCITSKYDCVFMYIGVFNAWIGGICAIAQMNPKKLLGYSSVANMGWMISLLPSKPLMGVFFSVYCATLIPILVLLFMNNASTARLNKMPIPHKLVVSIMLISLASIPPTPGFMAKWTALPTIMDFSANLLPPLALLMSSVPLALAYFNLMFNMWLTKTKTEPMSLKCVSFLFPLTILSLLIFLLPLNLPPT